MTVSNEGVEIAVDRYANNLSMDSFIVADGTVSIGAKAFRGCRGLKRIYIPSSVVFVGDKAFEDCPQVEIFCEGEPDDGWEYGDKLGVITYYTVTPEDYAFNFHRGPMSSTKVEREEVWFHDWNPLKRPVHTHVSKDVTKDW